MESPDVHQSVIDPRIRNPVCVSSVAQNSETEPNDEDVEEALDFVIGNAISILFHETGHMLISAYQLPVLGREEDAVDNLATILLMDWDDEEADQALIDSADAWFFSNVASDGQQTNTAIYGEHGLDEQRAFQIVCLMVGGNRKRFGDFANEVELPESGNNDVGGISTKHGILGTNSSQSTISTTPIFQAR